MNYRKNCHVLFRALFFILIATGISSSWASDQSSHPASPETLTGWFSTIWADDFKLPENSKVRHILADGLGNETELGVSEDILMQHGGIRGLTGQKIKVRVESAVDPAASGKRKVLSIELEATPPPSSSSGTDESFAGSSGGGTAPLSLAAQVGAKPYVTLLCKFSDTGSDPKKKSYFTGLMGSSYPGMDHYWRELSYNNINLTGSAVYGWYTLPHSRQEYQAGTYSSTNDCLAAADPDVYFPGYFGINLMLDTLNFPNLGGTMGRTLDGITTSYAYTLIYDWNIHSVVAHEMGHSLGLPHSRGPYSLAYGSLWDVMADGGNLGFVDPTYGRMGDHTISYHKDLLGWIPSGQKFTASSNMTQVITLERLALPTDGGSAYRMAVIPIDATHFYTVEARRFAGYDNGLPLEAVLIHSVDINAGVPATVIDPDNNGNASDAGAAWTVGESFESEGYNARVTVNSNTGTGYIVTIATTAIGPYIETNAATNALNGQATLNGRVNPKGVNADTWFEWGTTTAYGNSTALQAKGNGTTTLSFTQTLTGLTAGATYHYRAAAQSVSGTRYGADQLFTVTAQGPDLYLSQASAPAQASLGSLFNTIATVWNGGTDPTGQFRVGVYLADNPQASGWKRSIGGMPVSTGLAAGAGKMLDIPCAIPNDVTPGTYYVVGWADDTFYVIESNESNNTRSDGTIQITQSDLTLTALSGPSTSEAGLTINITNSVQNPSAYTSPSSYVGFFLSTDATITTADTLLGTRTVPTLNPGASSGATTTVTIPGSMPASSYYLGGIVDYSNSISESNENNNARTGNLIQIAAARPDLIVTAVTAPTSGRKGNPITGTVTLMNQGPVTTAAGSTVALYLSSDATITGTDISLGTISAPTLNTGASTTLSYSLVIPSSVARATYYIGAIADSANVIAEGNEANNARAGNTISIR